MILEITSNSNLNSLNSSNLTNQFDASLSKINLTQLFSSLKNNFNHTDFRLKHPINFTKPEKHNNITNQFNSKRPIINQHVETEREKKIKKMLDESLWLIPMSDQIQALI